MTGSDGLFGDLPEQQPPVPATAPAGRARLRVPVRDTVRLEVLDLDALIAPDHPARAIWAYAERVDFAAFEARVKARDGHPGQAQTAPQLLLALWLYAISDGVGSAREIARLCTSAPAYRWLCGGVGVNHHALSDFRTDETLCLDDLLARHVASLSMAGLIALDEIAQDGVKVRADAGAASFRRRPTLERELDKARAALARLDREEDADPGATGRRRATRVAARRASAARDRLARVEQALAALTEVEAVRAKRAQTNAKASAKQKEPRASTTDPQARVMKMPDGGFRPAYNVQFASLPGSGIVVGVQVGTVGSDRGLAEPMAAGLAATYGRRPERYLIDGGFQAAEDIEAAHAAGTAIYCPPGRGKAGSDPYRVRPGDGPGVAAWRSRMACEPAQAIYKRRGRCELIHARLRNLGLDRPLVRGLRKVAAWMTGFALAMNILTEHRLRGAALA